MSTSQATVANLGTSMDEFQSLVESLTDDQLQIQSLCPDWDVKGVILHVVGIEHILVDWLPESDDEAPKFGEIEAFIDEHADDDGDALKAIVAATLDRRRTNMASITEQDLGRKCMSPVGPATYGQFMDIRTFDIWIHHRDISTPLALASDDSGPAADAALDQVHNSLGYIVGKKIGLPDGMSITFDINGAVQRSMHVNVDGRAKVVPNLDGPASVVVSADFLTFMQLACGRINPEPAIAAGRITWTGDDEWGLKAASNLAFTM